MGGVEAWCQLLATNNNPQTPQSLCFYLASLELNKRTRECALNSKEFGKCFKPIKQAEEDGFAGRRSLMMLFIFNVETSVFWDKFGEPSPVSIPRRGDNILGMKLRGPVTLQVHMFAESTRLLELTESFELQFPYFLFYDELYFCQITSGIENVIAIKWIMLNNRDRFYESRYKITERFKEVLNEITPLEKNLKNN